MGLAELAAASDVSGSEEVDFNGEEVSFGTGIS